MKNARVPFILLIAVFLIIISCACSTGGGGEDVDPDAPMLVEDNGGEEIPEEIKSPPPSGQIPDQPADGNVPEKKQGQTNSDDQEPPPGDNSSAGQNQQEQKPSLSPGGTKESAAPEVSEPSQQGSKADALIITGNGVSAETAWTLSQLKGLKDGYREITYSTTNNWPTYGHITAQGVSLRYLLRQAGILSGATSIKFVASDGYGISVTYNQVFGQQYSYTSHGDSGSGDAVSIEPVIAWAWGEDGKVRAENLRPFFGHSGPMEVNTSVSVKNLVRIEVSSSPAGTWAVPAASIADGSVVSPGTLLDFLHNSLDSVRIYYTLDGSEPNFSSAVYNSSTSYFQPQRIKPLQLNKSVTIKAFAAGFGKDRSPVATFSYTVQ